MVTDPKYLEVSVDLGPMTPELAKELLAREGIEKALNLKEVLENYLRKY